MKYIPFDPAYWLEVIGNHSSKNSPTNKNKKQKDKTLESIISDREGLLLRSIKQLEFFYLNRKAIHQQQAKAIDYEMQYHKNQIYELDGWPKGNNSAVEKRRIHLERIRTTLEQEKRKHEGNFWRDLLSVKRDERLVLKEYIELMIKKRILDMK